MSGKEPAVRFDRVSSNDQRDGYSLVAQEDNGVKYAKRNKLNVVKVWSVSESASKEEDRTEFFDMIEFVKTNRIRAVIFDKVDRACRGLKSAVLIEELMDHHGVKFHFTREHLIIDRDSPPQEKLRFYLGIILAKYYIDNLKTEIRKGINTKHNNGIWNGKAPFGYINTRDSSSKKAIVSVDEKAAPIVQEIFELYRTGNYTLNALTDMVRMKMPEKAASKRLIETVLANPFYYGVMKVKGRIIDGAHEPLISKEDFDSVQKIRGIRAAKHNALRPNQISKPFMSFLKCGVCSHAVTGESVLKKSGRHYIYYRCANHKCDQYRMRVNQDDLFLQLSEAFKPFSKWTHKATAAFIETVHSRLQSPIYTRRR
jgi:DNA invertase Pin-like site-specific DNA recombinase